MKRVDEFLAKVTAALDAEGTAHLRQVVDAHAPLINAVRHEILQPTPPETVDTIDKDGALFAAGLMGLFTGLSAYDARRHGELEAYVEARIRQAMTAKSRRRGRRPTRGQRAS